MKKRYLTAVTISMTLLLGLMLGLRQIGDKISSETPEEAPAETTAVTTKEVIPIKPAKPKNTEAAAEKPRSAEEEFEIPPPNDEGEIVEDFAEIMMPEPPPPPTLPSEAYTNPAAPPEYEPEQTTVTASVTSKPSNRPEAGAKNGNKTYIPGLGWLDPPQPSHGEYADGMKENGNKIGYFG